MLMLPSLWHVACTCRHSPPTPSASPRERPVLFFPRCNGMVNRLPVWAMQAWHALLIPHFHSVHPTGTGQAVKDSGIPRKEVFMMSMVPYHLLGYNNTKAAVAGTPTLPTPCSFGETRLDYRIQDSFCPLAFEASSFTLSLHPVPAPCNVTAPHQLHRCVDLSAGSFGETAGRLDYPPALRCKTPPCGPHSKDHWVVRHLIYIILLISVGSPWAASLEQLQVDYIDLVMIHHRASDISGWPRTCMTWLLCHSKRRGCIKSPAWTETV